ncbi:MAG TPA: hypothetical protein VHB02_03020 [Acidimicrobiales bacterium]|nr:hypothetical protein [Acidimicrobiales bacterium]
MPKDRDQLTPNEPEDQRRLRPRRSAAREATDPVDPSTGPGPGSGRADPKAADEVGSEEATKYR